MIVAVPVSAQPPLDIWDYQSPFFLQEKCDKGLIAAIASIRGNYISGCEVLERPRGFIVERSDEGGRDARRSSSGAAFKRGSQSNTRDAVMPRCHCHSLSVMAGENVDFELTLKLRMEF